MSSKWIWIIVILVVVICLCASCLVAAGAGLFLIRSSETSTNIENYVPTLELNLPWDQATPEYATPWNSVGTPEPDFELQATPDPQSLNVALETLNTLKNEIVPNNDPRELAVRFEGVNDMPEMVPDHTDYKVGDEKQFWTTNVDTNENSKINAKLAYITDHVYFWIEKGVSYKERDLSKLVEAFENEIYPTNREFFGSEWSPGIDDNPRLFLLYASNLGGNLAGYFSSADSVPPQAHEFSNAHEMFLLNSDTIGLDEKFTYGVLAHEFQHMIHWYRDRNETSWLNEGFSELAAFINGYYESGFDYMAMSDPDIQLNDWPNDSNATTPHYGAGFLFVNYFLNRFGEDATKALVADEANGMESVDDVLKQVDVVDPITNEPITADDFFADWTITNYLHDKQVGDGRYTYKNYSDAPQAATTETISGCNSDWNNRTVTQYGADYIQIDCGSTFTIDFQGTFDVGVLPQNAHSGDYAFWSNKGDESDMTLTQSFDFTNVSEPVEMSFYAWYDIETDYDYLYLTASENGEDWEILQTPSCTSDDPSGNSFGCGYNDTTNGWIKETVDLSKFAGKKIQLRFEYITDAAVNGEGFMLDDVEIPSIGYSTDFETDDGGWETEGWVRIQNSIPQTYELTIIKVNQETQVERIPIDQNQSARITVNGDGLEDIILIVSGTSRFTRQEAIYRFKIQ
ncbi:MAG: hypothetical protein CVU46_02510 [Chloroflexi bacterium HGW-Chloroflexi-8]|nr:MAG: hypothetical protein CVU46_02510 [Chloroflexi bacterium HGW-Chloroflexi-8]